MPGNDLEFIEDFLFGNPTHDAFRTLDLELGVAQVGRVIHIFQNPHGDLSGGIVSDDFEDVAEPVGLSGQHIRGSPPEFIRRTRVQRVLTCSGQGQGDGGVVPEIDGIALRAIHQQEIVDLPHSGSKGTVGQNVEVVVSLRSFYRFVLGPGIILVSHAVVQGEVSIERLCFIMLTVLVCVITTVEYAQSITPVGQFDAQCRGREGVIHPRDILDTVLVVVECGPETLDEGFASVIFQAEDGGIFEGVLVFIAEPQYRNLFACSIVAVIAGILATTGGEQGIFDVVLSLRVGTSRGQFVFAMPQIASEFSGFEIQCIGVIAVAGNSSGSIPNP